MTETITGRCLCGAVSYTCTAVPIMMGHCHCDDCRRVSGSGHCSHILVPEDSVAVTGELRAYALTADSGNRVERLFCPTCGSGVFGRSTGMPGMMTLRASTLDDLEFFRPQMHVFTGRAASWDKPDESLPTFEAMPPGM